MAASPTNTSATITKSHALLREELETKRKKIISSINKAKAIEHLASSNQKVRSQLQKFCRKHKLDHPLRQGPPLGRAITPAKRYGTTSTANSTPPTNTSPAESSPAAASSLANESTPAGSLYSDGLGISVNKTMPFRMLSRLDHLKIRCEVLNLLKDQDAAASDVAAAAPTTSSNFAAADVDFAAKWQKLAEKHSLPAQQLAEIRANVEEARAGALGNNKTSPKSPKTKKSVNGSTPPGTAAADATSTTTNPKSLKRLDRDFDCNSSSTDSDTFDDDVIDDANENTDSRQIARNRRIPTSMQSLGRLVSTIERLHDRKQSYADIAKATGYTADQIQELSKLYLCHLLDNRYRGRVTTWPRGEKPAWSLDPLRVSRVAKCVHAKPEASIVELSEMLHLPSGTVRAILLHKLRLWRDDGSVVVKKHSVQVTGDETAPETKGWRRATPIEIASNGFGSAVLSNSKSKQTPAKRA